MYLSKRNDSEIWVKSLVGLFLALSLMMILSHYVRINTSVILWLSGLIGLLSVVVNLTIFKKYTCKKNTVAFGCIITLFQFIPVLLYQVHIFDDIKSIGLNITLLTIPLHFIFWATAESSYVTISDEDINRVIFGIFVISSIMTIIIFALEFRSIPRILSNRTNAYASAWNGFFPNKNMLGSFSALGLVAGIETLFFSEDKKKVILLNIPIAIALVFSLCRDALLFLGVFLLVFLLRRFDRKKQLSSSQKKGKNIFLITLIILVIAAIIAIMMSPSIRSFIHDKVLRLDIGDASRGTIQQNIINSINEKGVSAWLLGVGYSELNYISSHDCHSIYLYSYATGGIIKLLFLAIVLIFAIRNIHKCRNEFLKDYSYGILFAYLVFGFFETNQMFEVGLVNYEFFLFIFLLPALSLKRNDMSLQGGYHEKRK